MDVVREITEFYFKKREKGITGGVSVKWNKGTACRKKRESFYFRSFYIILNLEVR
jgi:hypothetical protein